MSKELPERKAYRKSPGRQYGYDYDPLHTQNDPASKSGTLSTQRPDPRRTRQLLRKSILEGKRSPEAGDEEIDALESEYLNAEQEPYQEPYEEVMPTTPYSRRHPGSYQYASSDNGFEESWQDDEEFDDELAPVDEGLSYEEYVNTDVNQGGRHSNRPRGRSMAARTKVLPEEDYDEEADYEEEEESPAPRRKRRKSKMSRRGLLLGAGAVVGTAAIGAAYELGPKLPQAANEIGSNLEHQLQEAFNKGAAQGAEQARREIITALDNLEGFTLEGAMSAARLTRVAYDVFVSPIVHFGSALTGDFLTGMLSALKTARGWLAGAYQDNASLAAIQHVLESWVSQVTALPKQLDAITQTDLDGAQGYLRALEAKLNEEKAKLNNPPSTTSTPNAQSTPQPKQQKQ